MCVKKWLIVTVVGLLVLPSCKSEETVNITAPQPPQSLAPIDNEVLATIRGEPITLQDVEPVLVDGYGLNVVLLIVQRNLAREEAAKQEIVVTPQDVAAEKQITLTTLSRSLESSGLNVSATEPSDQELTPQQTQQLLDQVLLQQHMSRAEFDILMEINAYLRKIAEPEVTAEITDDAVRQHFNVLYGEKVLVHYIQCGNMNEAADVRRDLAAGKSFEDVARARSRDRATAVYGGELPPFTLQDNRFPPEFKQLVFMLQPGQISDPLQIGQYIYIAKLVERIPPEHAKFEDYKDAMRKDLHDQAVQAAIVALRRKLAQMALDEMEIEDPVLRKQWEDRVARKDGQIKDMQEIRKQLDQEHAPATVPSPATQP
jgi:parvulin-like peptidyl-prolyl isomerase